MTTIRRATEADCRAMPSFRREMEGGAFLAELRNETFYRHKYLDAGVAVVAVTGDRLLGVTSAVPRRVQVGGRSVPAADLGDLFVRPEARGRGLFRRLHDAVLDELAAGGVRLVTVRAGPGAAPLMLGSFGYRRLFRIAESVTALTIDGRAELPGGRIPLLRSLLPRHRPRRPLPEDGFATDETTPAGLAGIAGLDGTGPGVVRDAKRLRARYEDDPSPYLAVRLTRDGEPVGGAVLLVYAGRGFVVDLFTAPDAAHGARRLARAALVALSDGGARIAHFWSAAEAASRDPGQAGLRAEGLRVIRRKKAVLFRQLGGDHLDLPAAGEWTFRMGDTDGI